MTVEKKILTTQALNNYITGSMLSCIKQARVHTINNLARRMQDITKRKKSDPKSKKKVTRMSHEIKALKALSLIDLSKLVLINKKSFDVASKDKSCAGQRLVSRLSEFKSVAEAIKKFREEFADTLKELPLCIKALGVQKRYKKVKKFMTKGGQKDDFLKKERFFFQLLGDVGGKEFLSVKNLYEKLKKEKAREKKNRKENDTKEGEDKEEVSDGEVSDDDVVKQNDEGIKEKIFQKMVQWKMTASDEKSDEDSDEEELFPSFGDESKAIPKEAPISRNGEEDSGDEDESDSDDESENEDNDCDNNDQSENDDSNHESENDDSSDESENDDSNDESEIEDNDSDSGNNDMDVDQPSKSTLKNKSTDPTNMKKIQKSNSKNNQIKSESTNSNLFSTKENGKSIVNMKNDKLKVESSKKSKEASVNKVEVVKKDMSMSEVKTLDLMKLGSGETISIGKRKREVDLKTEEMCELPRKMAEQKKKNESEEGPKKKRKQAFFGDSDESCGSDDEEDTAWEDEAEKFNKKFNRFDAESTKLQEALVKEGWGGSDGGRGRGQGGFGRGRGDGSASRGRGGFGGQSRGRAGFGGESRGRGGFGGQSRGRGGFGGESRGRGGFGGESRGRGGFGRGERDEGESRGRGGFGRGGGDRGRGGFAARGDRARGPLPQDTKDLHPSWAAKKNQSHGIGEFKGKIIKFD